MLSGTSNLEVTFSFLIVNHLTRSFLSSFMASLSDAFETWKAQLNNGNELGDAFAAWKAGVAHGQLTSFTEQYKDANLSDLSGAFETWKAQLNNGNELGDAFAAWKAGVVHGQLSSFAEQYKSSSNAHNFTETPDWNTAPRPIVMVSGCYDLLHSGHVAFFADAAQHGNLYVSVGSDANVESLKHHKTMFPEHERVYMVRAIRHVSWAAVCTGMGMLDWEADLDIVKPDIFFVNEDGDRPGKREACAKRGICYQVGSRDPAEGLTARSSTSIKAALDENKK